MKTKKYTDEEKAAYFERRLRDLRGKARKTDKYNSVLLIKIFELLKSSLDDEDAMRVFAAVLRDIIED